MHTREWSGESYPVWFSARDVVGLLPAAADANVDGAIERMWMGEECGGSGLGMDGRRGEGCRGLISSLVHGYSSRSTG
jgi:hypothetical protein